MGREQAAFGICCYIGLLAHFIHICAALVGVRSSLCCKYTPPKLHTDNGVYQKPDLCSGTDDAIWCVVILPALVVTGRYATFMGTWIPAKRTEQFAEWHRTTDTCAITENEDQCIVQDSDGSIRLEPCISDLHYWTMVHLSVLATQGVALVTTSTEATAKLKRISATSFSQTQEDSRRAKLYLHRKLQLCLPKELHFERRSAQYDCFWSLSQPIPYQCWWWGGRTIPDYMKNESSLKYSCRRKRPWSPYMCFLWGTNINCI
jgi:hypothetical protein